MGNRPAEAGENRQRSRNRELTVLGRERGVRDLGFAVEAQAAEVCLGGGEGAGNTEKSRLVPRGGTRATARLTGPFSVLEKQTKENGVRFSPRQRAWGRPVRGSWAREQRPRGPSWRSGGAITPYFRMHYIARWVVRMPAAFPDVPKPGTVCLDLML